MQRQNTLAFSLYLKIVFYDNVIALCVIHFKDNNLERFFQEAQFLSTCDNYQECIFYY